MKNYFIERFDLIRCLNTTLRTDDIVCGTERSLLTKLRDALVYEQGRPLGNPSFAFLSATELLKNEGAAQTPWLKQK